MDELEIDLGKYVFNDRGFAHGNDPNCLHQRVADWDGEDATQDLDVCADCGATRPRRG